MLTQKQQQQQQLRVYTKSEDNLRIQFYVSNNAS